MMSTNQSPNSPHLLAERANAGFTLIGVIVTTVITGVLATMAFDAGTEMIRTAQTNAAGSEIAAALHLGRQQAMTEQRVIFVNFPTDETERISQVFLVRDDGDGLFDPDDDNIFERIRVDNLIRLGDGQGRSTTLPNHAEAGNPVYGVAFGPRGEARNPTTAAPLAGFLNVNPGSARRGDFAKFSNIAVSPSGSIGQQFHRENVTEPEPEAEEPTPTDPGPVEPQPVDPYNPPPPPPPFPIDILIDWLA